MSRLPVCSGADAVKAFRKLGYEVDHQTGSHIILRQPSGRRLTVPNHRELAKGTLRALSAKRASPRNSSANCFELFLGDSLLRHPVAFGSFHCVSSPWRLGVEKNQHHLARISG
jgi:predicted RNA binding protein YcfA (HicA-like mRNA interferase family)